MSRLRGRFGGGTGALMERFGSSIEIDRAMLDEDIDGSIAHATMLGEVGMLTDEESRRLVDGLEAVRGDIAAGRFAPTDADEDIHMAVERALTERLGDLGKKLHTARSRNDQVATDVRLWLLRRVPALEDAIGALIEALVDRAEADGRALMAGYTHLQRGQPILLGHHLLAYAWALVRDRGRLADARRRFDRCPLGAGAMAGTPHPIDRRRTAELLGFRAPSENAMDAVAARDHAQEMAAACAIVMVHLSRMAEELIVWSSAEFGFVRLGEAYATGSSIMPQKRNPDAAELVRGKSGRVVGDLMALLTMVKGLPMAYNRDLQEDREALFDAVATTQDSLEIMADVFRTLEIRRDRFEAELIGDPSLATELADHLASTGVPFREAHEAIGRLVRWADENGRSPGRARRRCAGDLPSRPCRGAARQSPRSAGGHRTSNLARRHGVVRGRSADRRAAEPLAADRRHAWVICGRPPKDHRRAPARSAQTSVGASSKHPGVTRCVVSLRRRCLAASVQPELVGNVGETATGPGPCGRGLGGDDAGMRPDPASGAPPAGAARPPGEQAREHHVGGAERIEPTAHDTVEDATFGVPQARACGVGDVPMRRRVEQSVRAFGRERDRQREAEVIHALDQRRNEIAVVLSGDLGEIEEVEDRPRRR